MIDVKVEYVKYSFWWVVVSERELTHSFCRRSHWFGWWCAFIGTLSQGQMLVTFLRSFTSYSDSKVWMQVVIGGVDGWL